MLQARDPARTTKSVPRAYNEAAISFNSQEQAET
jgi:hypothetical protein